MNKFIEDGFFREDDKVYKIINGEKRLVVLFKPNFDSVRIDFNGETLDMEDTDNLKNGELIESLISNCTYDLDDINKEPYVVEDIHEGLSLYAVDISKIWNFRRYDSFMDVVYYDEPDKDTNELGYPYSNLGIMHW